MIEEITGKFSAFPYSWWNDEGEIKEDHVEVLEEHAEERIGEMVKEGYSSGELLCEIDDILYRGWWGK